MPCSRNIDGDSRQHVTACTRHSVVTPGNAKRQKKVGLVLANFKYNWQQPLAMRDSNSRFIIMMDRHRLLVPLLCLVGNPALHPLQLRTCLIMLDCSET